MYDKYMKKSGNSIALRFEIWTPARARTKIEVKTSMEPLVHSSSCLVIGVLGKGLGEDILSHLGTAT
jgi:hypothetical protein